MEGDLHNSTQQQRTITSSFINETVEQELQLTDLQQLNGAWLVPAICIGAAGAAGAVGGWVLNDFWEANKEDIADALHDLISDEKEVRMAIALANHKGVALVAVASTTSRF